MSAPDRFPPVEALVPHRGPSLLIQRVLEMGGNELRCAGRIPSESAFAAAGAAPNFVGLDLLAQAAAALETLQRVERSAAAPEIGYLVGIREARFETPTLLLGPELTAHVRLEGGTAALAHHEVRLLQAETLCLSAVLTTFRPSAISLPTSGGTPRS